MNTSPSGLELIKKHEGLRLRAYLCPANVPTIGYGHTGPDVTREDVRCGKTITQEQADALLRLDIAFAERAVNKLVSVPLRQSRFDALVSFVFNVGEGAFRKSTLLRLLNKGLYDSVPAQFARWVYAKRKILAGLVKRRADEAALFAHGGEMATADNVDSVGAKMRRMVGLA